MRLRLLTFAVAQRISPGVFSPDFAGKSIYVEDAAPDRRQLTGLFVVDRSAEAEGERLTLAPRGELEIDEEEGRLWLRLDEATSHHVGAEPPPVRRLVRDGPAISSRRPAPERRPSPAVRERSFFASSDSASSSGPPGSRPKARWSDGSRGWRSTRSSRSRRPALVFGLVGLPLGLVDAARRTRGRLRRFGGHRPRLLHSPRHRGGPRHRGPTSSPAVAMWLPDILLTLFGFWPSSASGRTGRSSRGSSARGEAGRSGIRRPPPRERPGVEPARALPAPPPSEPLSVTFSTATSPGRFLRVFALVVASFVAVYVLIDYLEFADDLAKVKPPARLLLAYYEALLPPILVDILPFAFLVAALITVAALVRSSEATAVSRRGRVALPAGGPAPSSRRRHGSRPFLSRGARRSLASAESETLKARLKGASPSPADAPERVGSRAGRPVLLRRRVRSEDARRRGPPDGGGRSRHFRIRVRAAAARAQVLPGQGLLAENGWIRSFTDGADSLFIAREGHFLLEAPEAFESISSVQANPRQMTRPSSPGSSRRVGGPGETSPGSRRASTRSPPSPSPPSF